MAAKAGQTPVKASLTARTQAIHKAALVMARCSRRITGAAAGAEPAIVPDTYRAAVQDQKLCNRVLMLSASMLSSVPNTATHKAPRKHLATMPEMASNHSP
jgi:hypothetical protein